MLSNLPPGCNSADGGIDHEMEKSLEEVDNLITDSGLDATEIVVAVKIGIAAIKELGPIREEVMRETRAEIEGIPY